VRNIRLDNATPNSLFIRWDASTPIGAQNFRHKLTIEGVDVDYSNTVDQTGDKFMYTFKELPELDGAGKLYKVSITLTVITPGENEVQSVAASETFATLPHRPSNLRPSAAASVKDGPLEITWTRSPTPHVSGYKVKWKSIEDGSKNLEGYVPQNEEVDELSFVFPTLLKDIVYKINVYAVVDLKNDETVESKELHRKVVWKEEHGLVDVEEPGNT